MQENLYEEFSQVQQKHWWFVAKKKIILSIIDKYFQKGSTKKILDAGCGAGLMLNSLKVYGTVSGMDFSTEAIKYSKNVFDGEVRQGELPNYVPYEKNQFDLVIALDVLEHIDEDVESMKSLRSRLTVNGLAVLTVPAYMFLWSEHDDINHHKRRYTLTEFRTKLLQAGFKIERISYFNSLLFPAIAVARFLSKVFNKKSDTDVALPSPLVNAVFENIFSLENYLLKWFNLPFGVSVLAVVRNTTLTK